MFQFLRGRYAFTAAADPRCLPPTFDQRSFRPLAGRVCLGRSSIPRFWASIWIDVLNDCSSAGNAAMRFVGLLVVELQ
jgi:hypothetical protein